MGIMKGPFRSYKPGDIVEEPTYVLKSDYDKLLNICMVQSEEIAELKSLVDALAEKVMINELYE